MLLFARFLKGLTAVAVGLFSNFGHKYYNGSNDMLSSIENRVVAEQLSEKILALSPLEKQITHCQAYGYSLLHLTVL